MIESDFLKHLDRMSLLISKRISSNFVGERQSLSTGRGTMFKDHGMYTPGDDFRAIDWKVYGRTDKLHIRRYEEDKALVSHIILDSSSSMNYGSGKVKKFDYASMVGLAFAYMSMKKNEKFVLSTFSENLDLIIPRKGKRHFVSVIDYLKEKEAKGKKIRTHQRDLIIVPELVGLTIYVYDGQNFAQIQIKGEMLGHKFGEYAPTRRKVAHGSAGVGATKGSKFKSKK